MTLLEKNLTWLKGLNEFLYAKYAEQPEWEPKSNYEVITALVEYDKDPPRPEQEHISANYYHSQYELIKDIEPLQGPDAPINMLTIIGLDGGHLLKNLDRKVENYLIVEPDLNSFLKSLEVVDWQEFLGSIKGKYCLQLGPVVGHVRDEIFRYVEDMGVYHFNIFKYMVGDEKHLPVWDHIYQCIFAVALKGGFYDDERIGIAHTMDKLQKHSKFLVKKEAPYIEKPVVVCGNGPSLNAIIPEIKAKRGDIYVMSCSSSIVTLTKNGVKPDFHIEQERSKGNYEFLRKITTPEDRKGVKLISLNVTHPEVCELFDETYHVLKSGDLGAFIAYQHSNDLLPCNYVNPYCGNAGASIAANMGFKNIYLAGTDCAYADDGKSHATGVDGYEEYSNGRDRLPCVGNFREMVMTDEMYIQSAQAFTSLSEEFPDTNFYNLCDGLKIIGYTPARSITTMGSFSGDLFKNFKPAKNTFNPEHLRGVLLSCMDNLREVVGTGSPRIIQAYLRAMRDVCPVFYRLMIGSFQAQLMFLMTCIERGTDEQIKQSIEYLEDFARDIHIQIDSEDFFAHDRCTLNVTDFLEEVA